MILKGTKSNCNDSVYLFGWADSDIRESISPNITVLYKGRKVIIVASCVITYLVNVDSCWATNMSCAMSRCPEQYIACEFLFSSPAESCKGRNGREIINRPTILVTSNWRYNIYEVQQNRTSLGCRRNFRTWGKKKNTDVIISLEEWDRKKKRTKIYLQTLLFFSPNEISLFKAKQTYWKFCT